MKKYYMNIIGLKQIKICENMKSLPYLFGEVMYNMSLRGIFCFIKNSLKKIGSYKLDEDAVQIMTVHKSKGLEFPVVILASLRENGFPAAFKEMDVESVEYMPEEFLGFDKYDSDAESSHIEEEERVIYVAKTRAEDELILSSIGEAPECVGNIISMNEYCG